MKMFVKDIRVSFVSRGNNGTYGEHYHYELEYWHMIDGRAEVRVGGKSYTLSSGQVFIAFPFVEHEYICDSENLSTVVYSRRRTFMSSRIFCSGTGR